MIEGSQKFLVFVLTCLSLIESATIKSSSYSQSNKTCSNAWKNINISQGSTKIACSQLCNSESKCLGFSLSGNSCSMFSEESLVHETNNAEDLEKHCFLQAILLMPSRAVNSSAVKNETQNSGFRKGKFVSELLENVGK